MLNNTDFTVHIHVNQISTYQIEKKKEIWFIPILSLLLGGSWVASIFSSVSGPGLVGVSLFSCLATHFLAKVSSFSWANFWTCFTTSLALSKLYLFFHSATWRSLDRTFRTCLTFQFDKNVSLCYNNVTLFQFSLSRKHKIYKKSEMATFLQLSLHNLIESNHVEVICCEFERLLKLFGHKRWLL